MTDLIEITPKQLDELNRALELCLKELDTVIRVVVPGVAKQPNTSGEAHQEKSTVAKNAGLSMLDGGLGF